MLAMMSKFDHSNTGALNEAEVRSLCEGIMNEVTPQLGGVTDEDVKEVMCLGGATAKPEVTLEELPKALSAVLAIKAENKKLHALYQKHDLDQSGSLDKSQLKPMLTELNDGIIPSEADLDFIVGRFDLNGDGSIGPTELRNAIAAWYVLQADDATAFPETVEAAKEMGYSDEQIAEWQEIQKKEEEEAAAAGGAVVGAGATAEGATGSASSEAEKSSEAGVEAAAPEGGGAEAAASP